MSNYLRRARSAFATRRTKELDRREERRTRETSEATDVRHKLEIQGGEAEAA